MAKKGSSKLNIAIIHPDLGIGGAERLIVDAAVELASHGHNVHVFTAHHDKNRCFEETISGTFPVTVYGAFLPRHIFYHLHALCAYLRCLFVALCMLVMWPSFDVILADQVSIVIPLLKLKKSTKVLFYCHFPDLLLAQHTTILRRIYRKPIDFIEEMTTGIADKILVNSKFTESMFAKTFKRLDARGVRPAVLYPAVNVNQFDEPTNSYKLNFLSINRFEKKKNIDLAILAFSMLRTLGGDVLQDLNLAEASLTIAGGFDKRLKENVEYLEELRSLAEREGVSSQVSVRNMLHQRRKSDREAVSEDDCLRAISKLKVLGNGFDVIAVGKRKLVRSVPTELNKDHNEILELAQAQGFVIVDEVERQLSWTTGCAIDAFDTLLDEGLAMIDDRHKEGICRYWFPCVSSISTPGGADT